jgi:hypothetical protein
MENNKEKISVMNKKSSILSLRDWVHRDCKRFISQMFILYRIYNFSFHKKIHSTSAINFLKRMKELQIIIWKNFYFLLLAWFQGTLKF